MLAHLEILLDLRLQLDNFGRLDAGPAQGERKGEAALECAQEGPSRKYFLRRAGVRVLDVLQLRPYHRDGCFG
jgi:hypothetical protein